MNRRALLAGLSAAAVAPAVATEPLRYNAEGLARVQASALRILAGVTVKDFPQLSVMNAFVKAATEVSAEANPPDVHAENVERLWRWRSDCCDAELIRRAELTRLPSQP